MEKYIDTIKEYAQKLAAAGSEVSDEDLVFYTLRGLPGEFNGFKTAIRTRGKPVVFDELVAMLNGEDLQLSAELPSDHTTVLVAAQENGKHQGMSNITAGNALSNSMSQLGISTHPPAQIDSNSQGNNRGRGGRGPRYFKDPCEICGRNNHTTNYCYYKSSNSNDFAGGQWKSNATQSQPPQLFHNNVSPQFIQAPHMLQYFPFQMSPTSSIIQPQVQYFGSSVPVSQFGGSWIPSTMPSGQIPFSTQSVRSTNGLTSASTAVSPAFAGFTGGYQPTRMVNGFYGVPGFTTAYQPTAMVASSSGQSAGPVEGNSREVPTEMPMIRTLEDINAQFEIFFLRTNRDAMSESHSSLPGDLAFGQRHESTNRQYHRMENNLDVTGVGDLSQNGEDTPWHSNRSSNIREVLHLESNESAARSPKSPKSEGQREVIEQFQPSVYVTLVQLQNGSKIFNRIRFSHSGTYYCPPLLFLINVFLFLSISLFPFSYFFFEDVRVL
ncbi:hypothetical protein Vadar_022169 [Vaccinium darrowii]|uniref:Uncharacterized protein n=1 Tax=Vaccinium darrowii TaxID=229202 RepID=A0ACB7YXR6_9ERIC|nr:hypothetical protein Vadar_022169 [Vaccinium darrowii]